jgi:Tol biopolymer transport system component
MSHRTTIIVAALLMAAATSASAWTPATIERVSVGPNGKEGNVISYDAVISAHGRYVAFTSRATNLVPGDTNGEDDVFVRDRQTGRTTRVSVGPSGAQGNDYSYVSGISADGRFVAFTSEASNLVADDTNGVADVFVRDRQTGRTTRVSVGSGGAQGNRDAGGGEISADGRFVAFFSEADNLVPNDTNNTGDAFVRDRQTGRTTRVSVDSAGAQFASNRPFPTAISPYGRYVGFRLLDGEGTAFLHDRQTGRTTRMSVGIGGQQANGLVTIDSISLHGRFVVLTLTASNLVRGDTNGVADVFVRDRQTGRTMRVSVGPGGEQGNGSSGDRASISRDGRFVAFGSSATNLVRGDTNGVADAFVRDRQTGRTTRISLTARGTQADNHSRDPVISADGRYVAFPSDATNLVPDDTNGMDDVFVVTRR